jgi:phosphatidylethanolamine/phosphatidyl-N-methylethanolamine N-methyltransferase
LALYSSAGVVRRPPQPNGSEGEFSRSVSARASRSLVILHRNRITGIDLSEAMLRKARRRVAELALTNVEKLEVMDAEHLSFADASFDVVVANHVISTVPNPEAALDECARTLRPGGEMILLSRIGADAGLRHLIERLLQPIVCRLGWRADFRWDRFVRWTERRTDMRLIERRPMPPFGHFSLLRFGKFEEGAGT